MTGDAFTSTECDGRRHRCTVVTTGAWIVVAAIVLGVGFGLYRLLTDGRFRGTHKISAADDSVVEVRGAPAPSLETTWTHVAAAIPDATLGDKATLVQFSSAFCAPCRATRRTLSEVAAVV